MMVMHAGFEFAVIVFLKRQMGSTSVVVPDDVGNVRACGTLTATGEFNNRSIAVGVSTEDGSATGI